MEWNTDLCLRGAQVPAKTHTSARSSAFELPRAVPAFTSISTHGAYSLKLNVSRTARLMLRMQRAGEEAAPSAIHPDCRGARRLGRSTPPHEVNVRGIFRRDKVEGHPQSPIFYRIFDMRRTALGERGTMNFGFLGLPNSPRRPGMVTVGPGMGRVQVMGSLNHLQK